MSDPGPSKHRPSSLDVGRAERALLQLAVLLAALAGIVNAIGFLAFGHVFLASPEANATVLGANLAQSYAVALFAGAMILSFVAGVTLMTLIAHRAGQFQRTLVLLTTALLLVGVYFAFRDHVAFAPAAFLAMAMGSAHCVFERDNAHLQEALSPSAQVARFGEALVKGRHVADYRQIGVHASFWLAFLFGGLLGAGTWIAFDAESVALTAGVASMLTLRTWLIERNLLPA